MRTLVTLRMLKSFEAIDLKGISTLTLAVMLFLPHSLSYGQNIVYSEDFESVLPPALPSGMTSIDGDMGTVDTSLILIFGVQSSWITRFDVSDQAAASTSFLDPVVQNDDWLITPQITIGGNAVLKWTARAQDAMFPDGYELRISTAGVAMGDFLANAPLFSVAQENSSDTTRSIDLAASGYTNTDIYLAWRNNSTNEFILWIDDIIVEEYADDDAGVSNVLLPVNNGCKLFSSQTVMVEVFNYGLNPIDTVDISYSLNGGSIVTETAIFVPIPPGASSLYTFSTSADLSIDPVYLIEVWTSLTGDGIDGNDTAFTILGSVNTHDFSTSGPYQTGFEITAPNDTSAFAWVFEDSTLR